LSEHQQAALESRQAIQRFSDLEPQIADLDCKLAMRNAELAATEQAVLELDHEREEMLKRLEYSAALEAVAQTRISSLNSDCDRFRSVRDELEAVVESLQQQADSAEQDASRLIAQKAEAAGSLEGLLESVEKLHSQELSLRQACESAEEMLLEWTNTADQLVSRVETLTEQVGLLDSQKLEAVVAIEGLLQQIDEAKIERDQLNAKNLIQASAVEGAEARLSSIQQQMQSKEIELNDLINQLVSTEMQFASVSERCLVEQAELQRLVECSRRAEADADTLRAEKELLDERRLELVREIDGFEAKRADAMNAANAEAEQLLILESKLHDASKELQTFAIQREHFQQESVQHAQLQANIAAAQFRLDDLIAQGQLTERASKDARDELNQIQRSIREVRLDMDALVSKEDRLNEELEALRTERDKLESECQRIEKQRKASEQVVAERTASLDKINDECIKAESRREKLFKTLDSISKEVDEAQSVCNQWDVYGNKLKSENELLAGELAQLRGSLQSIEKERSALEQSKIALEASLNKLRKEAVTVAAEVEGKETKLMDLREEQSRLLHLVGRSQSEFEDIQSRIQTSNFELIQLRSELENAKNDVFEHRHRCAELVNQSGELAERTKSQTSLYEAARLKVDEAERDLELRYAKMSEVERLLSERTSLAKDLLRQVDQSKEALELLECQLHATTDSQMQQASELAATKSEIQSQKLIMDGHCEQISHAVVHIQSLLVEKDRIQLTVGELNEESERTKVALRERELELHAMESKRDAMADEIRKRQLLVEQLEGLLSSVQAAVQDEESQFQTRKIQQQIALDALKKEMDAFSVEHEDARLQRTAMEQSIRDRQADLEKLRMSITELQAERADVEAEGVERRESLVKEFSRLQDQHTAMQEQVQNAEAALASKAEALLRLDVAIRDLDEHEQELRLAVERLVKEQTVYDARVLELRCEEENRVTNVSKLEEQIANLQVAESVLTVRIETVQQEIADMLAKRELQDNSTQRKVRIVKLGVRRVTNEQPGNVVPTETVQAQVSPAGAIPADSIPVDSVLTEGTELNAVVVSTTSEGIAEEDLLGEVVQSVDEVAKIVASEMGGERTEGKSVSTLVETEIVDDAWSFVLSSSK
jgi:chromosome segregation ATPase